MLQLSRFIFPLFSAIQTPEIIKIQRFLGCGFWLDVHGRFATCKHVLEQLVDGQVAVIGQPDGPRSDHFFPVKEAISHARFDVVVGRASPRAVGGVLRPYGGSVGLGVDVQAFGYTDYGKEGMQYQVDPRLLRGHTSRVAAESFGLPSPSLIEVSFGSPSGFSGAPLLAEQEVVGILYSNLDSKLQAYSIEEVTKEGTTHREVAYRIYEYGIAHRFSDLTDFFTECGVGRGDAV